MATDARSAPQQLITEENLRRVPSPCVVVIFGASGDLTERKLLPALFSLTCEGLLPEHFRVVGVARSGLTDESFREKMQKGITAHSRLKPDQCQAWDTFANNLFYLQADYDDQACLRRSGEARRVEMTLSATRRLGLSCSASYTVPMPP
ncbi:MAG: hypothetical protein R3264_08090, partial [Anaerolineae bacterium]|nr:hypothetical protein [Anaerolineae bacterium]